ncbi:putative very-long-chain (3R)-3-hydroxyacyl-CoA dehydratase [Nosema granulosis]|uniref:Very-long-chain (3R)-3-hydroxyacyl-CoA dehydratase n=1 Tax=Nosema granulosis TaxID=83296 RepID=A0A9P6H0Q1_9MICR|nr:putative very-long-chain (3R)-3-hydroxyacyl-CoA dehydratase [Nosema granulosis]
MRFPYITLCNLAGAVCSLLAFIFGHIYYNTRNRTYLLATVCLQTLFIMEIVNIKLHKSTSRYAPTVMQLGSRMFTLWVVCLYYKYFSLNIPIMVTCWYLTDFTRYIFYAFRNEHIKKLRYSLSILTYPTAFFCELMCIYHLFKKEKSLFRYLFVLILIGYIPGVIFLMRHMLQQRYWSSKKQHIRKTV